MAQAQTRKSKAARRRSRIALEAAAEEQARRRDKHRLYKRFRRFRQMGAPSLESAVARFARNPGNYTELACERYLEFCDQVLFEDPKRGLILATGAPVLAGFVADAAAKKAALKARALKARAFAILGGAYRAVGNLAEAERTYEGALELIDRIPKVDQADVWRRLSNLRTWQGRHAEARDLSNRAVRICRTLLGEPGGDQKVAAQFPMAVLARAVAVYYAVCVFRRFRPPIPGQSDQ